MSGTNTPERDAQLLSIGHQCSFASCLLVDFLPFKCQHCDERFCAEHYSVDAHKCSKYDERKFDRIAPSCPLCNEPVAIRQGQDPNVRMEHHISTECSVMTGKAKKKSAPICARAKCGKVLFAPIRCDKCKQQFCPAHRFPADHTCASATTTTAKPATNLSTKASETMDALKKATGPTSSVGMKASATVDAIKKAVAPIGSTSPSATKTSTTPSSHANPFSKSDRSSPRASTACLPPSPMITPISITPPPQHTFDPMSFIPRPIFASA